MDPSDGHPRASYPDDGSPALRVVARALTEGLLTGLGLALLAGVVAALAGGLNPLWTVVALPLTGPVGLLLGLLGAVVALLLARAELARDQRRGHARTPARLVTTPALVVGASAGLVVLLVLARVGGGGTLPPAVVAFSAAAGLASGAVVAWRGAALLRARRAGRPQVDGVRSSMPHGEP